MTINAIRRRSALARQRAASPNVDTFFERRCAAIHQGKFIPIIGDTIRIAHIFDVDYNENLGESGEAEQSEDLPEVTQSPDSNPDFNQLNVIEELAYLWGRSEGVNYPLTDGFRIARVAQFHSLIEENSTTAKEDYLTFLKQTLLDVAYDMEEQTGDQEEIAYIAQLRHEKSLSFSDIVAELDFPRFAAGKEDPLRTLARLPLKIYLTTSYHNFIEHELEAAGKQPHSRLCFWNMKPDEVLPEHRPDPTYRPDKDQPVVYHLLGLEQYPKSMVLSEDDYLDLLWTLARDAPGLSHSGDRIIPPYLEAELKSSSLLLLGYRLQDWDLRVLFRGLLKAETGASSSRPASTAIQINLKDQPLVQNEAQTELYLERFFKQAFLDVRFGDSDNFIQQLWYEWQRWNQGAK